MLLQSLADCTEWSGTTGFRHKYLARIYQPWGLCSEYSATSNWDGNGFGERPRSQCHGTPLAKHDALWLPSRINRNRQTAIVGCLSRLRTRNW